jgi:hypothetical protein
LAGGFVRSPKRICWRDIDEFFVYRLPKGGKMIGLNHRPGARKAARKLPFGPDGALPKCWPGSPDSTATEGTRSGPGPHRAQISDTSPRRDGGA